jgi:hypothetical protein
MQRINLLLSPEIRNAEFVPRARYFAAQDRRERERIRTERSHDEGSGVSGARRPVRVYRMEGEISHRRHRSAQIGVASIANHAVFVQMDYRQQRYPLQSGRATY